MGILWVNFSKCHCGLRAYSDCTGIWQNVRAIGQPAETGRSVVVRGWGVAASGGEVSLRDDENVLELDSGDAYTVL